MDGFRGHYPAPYYSTRYAHWAALLAALQHWVRSRRVPPPARLPAEHWVSSRWTILARGQPAPDR
jgi:hypothetical protein